MQSRANHSGLADEVSRRLGRFSAWLNAYGETSRDHQSLFAGPIGSRAKAFYYRHKLLGTAAVAPMIFCEAFLPSARRFFHHPVRFPIADAHYAMGFAFLHESTNDPAPLHCATHFLQELKKSRCVGYQEYCWGYPFDWVTRGGVIKQQTPLITSTPYAYEAFRHVAQILEANSLAPSDGERARVRGKPDLPKPEKLREIMASIVRHACTDIKDSPTSKTASTCSYSPDPRSIGVVNASAYRAAMLTYAARDFSNHEYWQIAERNLNFVLENQNADGSWFYAGDGVRHFVDHFHTCFVLKGLAKIHALTNNATTFNALERGVKYYLENLFNPDGLPKPFAKAPRLTVYTRELYDCAECINICLLLRDRFPQLQTTLETVITDILTHWIKPNGCFRARKLTFGWDNVPMHRWGQSQMFRSLAFYLVQARKEQSDVSDRKPELSRHVPQRRI